MIDKIKDHFRLPSAKELAVKELEMVHKEFAQVMDVAENEQKNMKQGEALK